MGATRVAEIVRAIKEFSHPGPIEKTPLDINRAIESTVLVSRNEWKYVADLETQLDADLPPVVCMPGEFNQVMLNLIVNAAHAIADVVGPQPGVKGHITVSTHRDGDWVEIRVRDTGTGIPKEVQPAPLAVENRLRGMRAGGSRSWDAISRRGSLLCLPPGGVQAKLKPASEE